MVSDFEFLCGTDGTRQEFVEHRFNHDEPLCADAGLSVVTESPENSHGNGVVEVAVIENNKRVASAQFHSGLPEILARPGRQGRPSSPRARHCTPFPSTLTVH